MNKLQKYIYLRNKWLRRDCNGKKTYYGQLSYYKCKKEGRKFFKKCKTLEEMKESIHDYDF